MQDDLIAVAERLEKQADRIGDLLSDPPKPHPEATRLRAEAKALRGRAAMGGGDD